MASFQLTYGDVLTLLSIIAVGMLIVILFNLIFVSFSLRKITDRFDQLSKDLEAIILKPIGAVDYIVDWFIAAVEGMHGKKKHRHEKEKGKKG